MNVNTSSPSPSPNGNNPLSSIPKNTTTGSCLSESNSLIISSSVLPNGASPVSGTTSSRAANARCAGSVCTRGARLSIRTKRAVGWEKADCKKTWSVRRKESRFSGLPEK